MKFSIIVCTYNASRKLSRTLDSVVVQTLNDFEVIIIDGLSVDGTQSVVKSYQQKYPEKICFLSERDLGIYDAMNKGVRVAKGEYVYFLGSGDELYNSSVLQKVNSELLFNKLDVLYGDVELGNTTRIYGGQFTKERLLKENISHQSIFFKRDIFRSVGEYDIRYVSHADWVHNMKWFNSSAIISQYVPLTIARYELGGRSKTVFDAQFYKDIVGIVRENFTDEYVYLFEKIKGKEVRFITSKFRWVLWELKNKVFFALFAPIDFIKKYFL